MERHIVEILVILTREYPEGAITREGLEPLNKEMIEMGYSQQEIEAALLLYHSRQLTKQRSNHLREFKSHAFRMLHEVEQAVLKPEAYGYLIKLQLLGLISLNELDEIIEKSVLLGGRKVDIDDVKTFVAAQIMEQDNNISAPGLGFYMKTPSDRIQ
ncbi:MAG TPA: DUF494 family protein [Bacteroidetes bacterium]|nr:DUF494 family protein [Bacteroidota bacterium]